MLLNFFEHSGQQVLNARTKTDTLKIIGFYTSLNELCGFLVELEPVALYKANIEYEHTFYY